MGRLAVDRLAAMLADPDRASRPEQIRLPMSLKIRESTGPAPGGSAT
jgi:DNA-binding LacI/PurR family transcriptional regulator